MPKMATRGIAGRSELPSELAIAAAGSDRLPISWATNTDDSDIPGTTNDIAGGTKAQ